MVGRVALVAVVEPTILLGFVVWAILVLGFMLDSADGQLARLRAGGAVCFASGWRESGEAALQQALVQKNFPPSLRSYLGVGKATLK